MRLICIRYQKEIWICGWKGERGAKPALAPRAVRHRFLISDSANLLIKKPPPLLTLALAGGEKGFAIERYHWLGRVMNKTRHSSSFGVSLYIAKGKKMATAHASQLEHLLPKVKRNLVGLIRHGRNK
jgi:hypothetical protein